MRSRMPLPFLLTFVAIVCGFQPNVIRLWIDCVDIIHSPSCKTPAFTNLKFISVCAKNVLISRCLIFVSTLMRDVFVEKFA